MSLSTVRDFEKERRTPIQAAARAIVAALEAGGVRLPFDEAGAPTGVAKIP